MESLLSYMRKIGVKNFQTGDWMEFVGEEVLLVDDGSNDGGNTEKIIDEYICKDARIRLLKQANQGPAAARQHGVEAAQGKYVYVCDQDDYLHRQLLEYCLFAVNKYKVDFVAFMYAPCAGDKIPDTMPLGDFDAVPTVTPESDYQPQNVFSALCFIPPFLLHSEVLGIS